MSTQPVHRHEPDRPRAERTIGGISDARRVCLFDAGETERYPVCGCPGPRRPVDDVPPGVSAMMVEPVGIRAEQRRPVTAVCGALADAAALCSCAAMSLVSSAGEIIVLRVAGEVDLCTLPVLRGALTGSLACEPCHLVVDLSGLTFCGVRGATLLVQAGRTAASHGTGYAVTAVPGQVIRIWLLLWPAGDLPIRYPTAAAGIRTAMAASPFTTAPEASLSPRSDTRCRT